MLAAEADDDGGRNHKINLYVHFRSPVLQLQLAVEEDDGGHIDLKINLYVLYRSPSIQQ